LNHRIWAYQKHEYVAFLNSALNSGVVIATGRQTFPIEENIMSCPNQRELNLFSDLAIF